MPHESTQIILDHYRQGSLHHAYLIVADPEKVRVDVETILGEILGSPLQGHADFWSHRSELFGIKEGRLLREAQSMKAFGERRCFVIETHGMTDEAENALLKTLEEPVTGNHFFIITPHIGSIRDTLLSRLFLIEGEKAAVTLEDARKFLELTPQARVRLLEKFLPKKTATPDEKKVLKRKFGIFVEEVERAFHEKHKPSSATHEVYQSLGMITTYLRESGAATRLLAEHLALVLPHK